MKIINYTDIGPTLFDNGAAKKVAGRVALGKADGADNFCMRVFEVEKNGHTPRHTHEWEHEIFFHSGIGEVLSEGKWTKVFPGTALLVPGNEEHQIRNQEDAPLVFVCLIPAGIEEL